MTSTIYDTFRHYLETDSLWGMRGEPYQHLEKAGLLDKAISGPDIEAIRPLLVPQGQKMRHELEIALPNCHVMGAVHETLGNLTTALNWYRLGQYLWRADQPSFFRSQGDARFWHHSDASAQVVAALCASRIGDDERAKQLYRWVIENSSFDRMEKPVERISYPNFWMAQTPHAYALCLIERWGEAAILSEQIWEAANSYDNFTRQTDSHLLLVPVLLALSRYRVNPTAENRQHALEMIHPQGVATFANNSHLFVLPYIYALRARFPDLANPPDHEAPLPIVVHKAAVECQAIFAPDDASIDGTVDSFKRLDPILRNLYALAPTPDQQKNLFLLLASYIGEAIRNQLPGGKWKAAAGPTLHWEIGDATLEIWPFEFLRNYLDHQTQQSLVEYWQEAESAFIEFGLAARYAD